MMLTFKDFIKIKEYNTTGEVDSENNTDLGKPINPTRWWGKKKKNVIRSKYVAESKVLN